MVSILKKSYLKKKKKTYFIYKGVQGAFDGHGAKTVIPRKVIGKFSIRIVPNHDPKKVEKLVVDYLEKKFKERNSPNKLK